MEKLLYFHIMGLDGFVLKEILKLIKRSLKQWHKSHNLNLNGKISKAKDRLFSLDVKVKRRI